MMPEAPVIFIAGVPTIGKSSLSQKISKKLAIPLISTDIIKRVMITTTRSADFPAMHFLYRQNPDHYFRKVSNGRFLRDFINESKEVFKAIIGVLDNNKAISNKGVIIEGSALLPPLSEKLKKRFKCRIINIIASEKREIESNLGKRGLWAVTHEAKKKEADMIYELNQYYLFNAEKYGQHVVYAKPYNNLTTRILKIIWKKS